MVNAKILIVSLLFVFALAMSVEAQSNPSVPPPPTNPPPSTDLTQTYTSADGNFSFMYPEGWTVQEFSPGIYVGDSGGNGFGIIVTAHNLSEQAKLGNYDCSEENLATNEGIQATYEYFVTCTHSVISTALQYTEIGGKPVALINDSHGPSMMLDLGTGVPVFMGSQIMSGDPAAYTPVFMAIAASMQWNGGAATTSAANNTPKGLIAYTFETDANYDIYVANADGTNPRNLTNNPGSYYSPSWSPDGAQLAFVQHGVASLDIYVMNADGINPHNLTANPATDQNPVWSPDGSQIAFDSDRDGNYEVYIMNADGSNVRRLTNDPDFDVEPSWSPDGSKIVFASKRDGDLDIYLMDIDGSNIQLLTDNSVYDAKPVWSPDGSQIAFDSDRAGTKIRDVYIMDANGSNVRPLTNTQAYNSNWSPDGSQLVFTSRSEIFIINADGTNMQRVTNDTSNGTVAAYDDYAAWQPVKP